MKPSTNPVKPYLAQIPGKTTDYREELTTKSSKDWEKGTKAQRHKGGEEGALGRANLE